VGNGAGAGMAVDISEQPDVLARLTGAAQEAAIAQVAAVIAAHPPRQVIFAAVGASCDAARYGAFLVEVRLGLLTGLAAPAAFTVFGARPEMSGALMIGLSREGTSPEVTEVLRAARAGGALTVAVTNDPKSPVARTADEVIDIAAGPERAVAATKTYTAELLALLMLVEGVRAGNGRLPPGERAALAVMPELAALTIADPAAPELAQRLRMADRIVTSGQGYAYATAGEAARKLMETSPIGAMALAGADLPDGPLAMTDPEVPLLAVVGAGPGGRAMREVLARLGRRRGGVVAVGAGAVEGVTTRLRVPAVEERHAPLLDVIPLQRLALALALARGRDPDASRGLPTPTATRAGF
jgi:glutamine---fructose-6-phosphate transaminase (isomerizing)